VHSWQRVVFINWSDNGILLLQINHCLVAIRYKLSITTVVTNFIELLSYTWNQMYKCILFDSLTLILTCRYVLRSVDINIIPGNTKQDLRKHYKVTITEAGHIKAHIKYICNLCKNEDWGIQIQNYVFQLIHFFHFWNSMNNLFNGYVCLFGTTIFIYPWYNSFDLWCLLLKGAQMAQWVRSLDLTTHTSLSPIRRGFAPGFVNYKKGCTRLTAASDKVY